MYFWFINDIFKVEGTKAIFVNKELSFPFEFMYCTIHVELSIFCNLEKGSFFTVSLSLTVDGCIFLFNTVS